MKLHSIIIGITVLIAIWFEYANGNSKLTKEQKTEMMLQKDSLWNKISDIETQLSIFSTGIRKLPKEVKDTKLNLFYDSVYLDGISRWKRSSKDFRRYKWFLWITRHPPRFYDAQEGTIDLARQNLWQQEYNEMAKEYFGFLTKEPKDQIKWSRLEFDHLKLQGDLELAMVLYKVTGRKLDLMQYQDRAVNLAQEMRETDFFYAFRQSLDNIISNSKYFGLTEENEIKSFLSYLKTNGNVELANWASGKERMQELKEVPFDYNFQIQDRKTFDLTRMRGKVILIDFWATWCSTCLAKMPMIKEVHDKYRDQGFEVLSVSINLESERAKVQAIEERMRTNWPLSIIGNTPIKNEIWKRFAFTSVPQLLLLGKDGKLIENNGQLFNKSTLDKLVKEALSL